MSQWTFLQFLNICLVHKCKVLIKNKIWKSTLSLAGRISQITHNHAQTPPTITCSIFTICPHVHPVNTRGWVDTGQQLHVHVLKPISHEHNSWRQKPSLPTTCGFGKIDHIGLKSTTWALFLLIILFTIEWRITFCNVGLFCFVLYHDVLVSLIIFSTYLVSYHLRICLKFYICDNKELKMYSTGSEHSPCGSDVGTCIEEYHEESTPLGNW